MLLENVSTYFWETRLQVKGRPSIPTRRQSSVGQLIPKSSTKQSQPPMRGVLPTGQEKKEHREVQGNPKQAHNRGRFRAALSLCPQQSQQAFCAA